MIEISCKWELWVHLGMQAGIETAMLFLDEGETVSAILLSATNTSFTVLLAVLMHFIIISDGFLPTLYLTSYLWSLFSYR